MTCTRVVVRKEIAEVLGQKKNLAGLLFSPLLMIFIALSIFPGAIDSLREIVPVSVLIPKFLDTYGFNYTLFLIVGAQTAVASDIFILEKTRKSIEVTLTTPLGVRDILLGKITATFIIVYPVSVGSFFAVSAIMWAMYGFYLPSLWTFLYIFTILPVMAMFLLAMMGLLQLSTRNYKAAGAIFYFVMMLTIFIPSFFFKEMPEAKDLFIVYALVCAFLGVVIGRLGKHLLDKERVVTTGG